MRSVAKKSYVFIIGFALIIVLFLGLLVVPYFANIVMPWNRTQAIETALKWGGLANLPDKARNISVSTQGSMFTRTMIIEFSCNENELQELISISPGLKNFNPTHENHGIVSFQLSGKEGANGGTLRIDKNIGKVRIVVNWS